MWGHFPLWLFARKRSSRPSCRWVALEAKLDRDQIRLFDEVSAVPLGFPHEFYQQEMVRNIAYGGMPDKIITSR